MQRIAPANLSISSVRIPAAEKLVVQSFGAAFIAPTALSVAFEFRLPVSDAPFVISASRPPVLSLPLDSIGPLVRSFEFAKPADKAPLALAGPAIRTAPVKSHSSPTDPSRFTRIRPPEEIIKLEDRLYFVLQPSLETLIARGSLEFPHQPFAYQLQGVAFLYPRYSAVLADEMGLGKTMQAITAIRMLLHAGEVGSVLLVCPKPLVTNWQREFAMWAPELPVAIVEGDPARRAWQWQQPGVPVRIANYESLCRDAAMLCDERVRLDLVVLDEAQRIKNRAGVTSDSVCSLSRRRSWALTGTPVENSPDDLLGIFKFVAPGHLNANMKPRTLGRAANDYVLRRTKDKVLADLPPKLFRDAELELSPEQRESYKLAEDDGVLRLTELGDSVTIQHVFELVLRLKQICNFDPATGASAKFERLAVDLEEVVASGQKAIVFSQWVKTLRHLRGELCHLHPLEYHGEISPNRRDAIIEQFRNERRHHVLLMSYGAGGVGLNLQFCGYVFLFDRWWNPAVEDQAINRAHRIGVTGPVTVTRFLMLRTIEERINQVLAGKARTVRHDFHRRNRSAALTLSQKEIFGLFNLRCPHGAINTNLPNCDAA